MLLGSSLCVTIPTLTGCHQTRVSMYLRYHQPSFILVASKYFGYVSWNIHLPHRQQIRKKEIVREYSFSAYLLRICVENTTNEKHLGGRWSFSRYRVLLHPELIMLPSIVTPWKYKCYKILLISSVIPSPSHQSPDGTQKYCILCKFVNVNISSKECKAR